MRDAHRYSVRRLSARIARPSTGRPSASTSSTDDGSGREQLPEREPRDDEADAAHAKQRGGHQHADRAARDRRDGERHRGSRAPRPTAARAGGCRRPPASRARGGARRRPRSSSPTRLHPATDSMSATTSSAWRRSGSSARRGHRVGRRGLDEAEEAARGLRRPDPLGRGEAAVRIEDPRRRVRRDLQGAGRGDHADQAVLKEAADRRVDTGDRDAVARPRGQGRRGSCDRASTPRGGQLSSRAAPDSPPRRSRRGLRPVRRGRRRKLRPHSGERGQTPGEGVHPHRGRAVSVDLDGGVDGRAARRRCVTWSPALTHRSCDGRYTSTAVAANTPRTAPPTARKAVDGEAWRRRPAIRARDRERPPATADARAPTSHGPAMTMPRMTPANPTPSARACRPRSSVSPDLNGHDKLHP